MQAALLTPERRALSVKCRHCAAKPAAVDGLCAGCFGRVESRVLYRRSGVAPFGNQPDTAAVPPLPDEPCDERPGTTAKIEVMRERYCRGEQLFHPDDPTLRN